MKVQGTTVTTTSVLFPLSFKFQIYLHSGNYNLVTKMKIMTGAKLVVDDNSTLIANKDLIVYKEFNDQSKLSPLYPVNKSEGEFIIKGDATINSAFGGKIQTSNDKKNDANLNINTSALSVTSKEAYNTDAIGAFFGKVEGKYPVTEHGIINLNTNDNTSFNNLEKTIYYSLNTDDFFIKATNLGEYKIIFHLNGGTIDGSTNDVEQTYKIAKESTTIRGISLADPVKKYNQFDGWFLSDNITPAIGQTVYKGQTLDLYAHYSLANYNINYMVVYDDDEGKIFDSSHFKPTFNYDELDLTLEMPVDPEYHFYGWYINNDLTNTVNKITKEMGYQDINLYGVFSKSIVCKVTFDANGHPDYFKDLESFNILTSDSKNVKLPTSLYNEVSTKEYYLEGFVDQDEKIFVPETYGTFSKDSLVLKAKWVLKNSVTYYDRHGNATGDVDYFYKTQNIHFRSEDSLTNIEKTYEDNSNKNVHKSFTFNGFTDSLNGDKKYDFDSFSDTVMGDFNFKVYPAYSVISKYLLSFSIHAKIDLKKDGSYNLSYLDLNHSLSGNKGGGEDYIEPGTLVTFTANAQSYLYLFKDTYFNWAINGVTSFIEGTSSGNTKNATVVKFLMPANSVSITFKS